MTHAIHRTSPKGQPFKGVCAKCGQEDLNFEDALKDCTNPRGTNEDQDLAEAIRGSV